MGITGLLPFLKKASRGAHLRDFRGQTAAVDVYCWLHKGAFACADKLVKGEATDGYVVYVMKQVNLLLSHGVQPIMVFDGYDLPSKSVTETKRRERREKSRKQAKELLRQGRTREALEQLRRSVEVTSEMAYDVINACRARSVDVIVAPYEADAQLAFLNVSGLADVVITEDSDLVVFGCKAILFKMDSNGSCVYVEKEKLHLALNTPPDKFSFEKFRNMTILSGCDYLPSLPGIGLVKACKFFKVTANTDTYNVLCRLPSYLKMPNLEVTQEYRTKFMQAINTFLYQLVFDPVSQTLRPLNQYPDNTGPDDYPYAGDFVGHDRARQIALGNVNVQTGEVVDHFDPETYEPPAAKSSSWEVKATTHSRHPSIWIKSPVPEKKEAPSLLIPGRPSTSGKEVRVAMPLFKIKHKIEPNDDGISEEDLKNLYSQPQKRKKIEASPEPLEKCLNDSSDKDPVAELLLTTNPNTASLEDVEDSNDHDMNSATPAAASRRKNPFAKRNLSPKKFDLPNSDYKAVKKFSKMKKTGIDSNIIVQSRFFTSNTQIPSSSSQPTVESKVDQAENQSIDTFCKELRYDTIAKETKSLEITPRNKSHPLSPTFKKFKNTKKSAFNWKQFSYKSPSSLKIERSASAASTFRTVFPKDKHEPLMQEPLDVLQDEVLPSDENYLRLGGKVEEMNSRVLTSSQTSMCTDVDSIDNESFGLTPSLPSSLESSEVTPLKDATNCLPESNCFQSSKDTQESVSVGKSQHRTPGLPRRDCRKKEVGKKQLSLTDMFSYKRSGHNQ